MDISKFLSEFNCNSLSKQPMYKQILDYIKNGIITGTIPDQTKLPSERELASLYKVSRTTIINAYRQLEQQGFVQSKLGSGTYAVKLEDNQPEPTKKLWWPHMVKPCLQTPLSSWISELSSNQIDTNKISLDAGMPEPKFFPIAIFQQLMNENISYLNPHDLGHIAAEGYWPLRHSILDYVLAKNIKAEIDNIAVVSGSQQGLFILSQILLEPGDYVIMETPSYVGAIQIFKGAKARILSLPQEDGFSFSALEDYLVRYRPKLLYLSSTFQNPTGRVLSLQERKELLKIAARHRLIIIEDDTYSELYYNESPPQSMKAMDNYDGVVYLSTFSKILFPGLRIGFIVGNETLIKRVAVERQYMDLHGSNIPQWLLHLYLEQNYLADHLKFIRKEYGNRQIIAARALREMLGDKIGFIQPDGGFYLWCKIHEPITSAKLLPEALKNGVSFVPGEAFYPLSDGSKEFRICFSSQNERSLLESIERLAYAFEKLLKRRLKIGDVSETIKPIV